jgi:protein phosphatase
VSYVWATGTHIGRLRDGNEDAVFPEGGGSGEGPLVIAVADGMGGHVGGEIASEVAITAATTQPADTGPMPHERVTSANAAIVAHVADHPWLAGMGTTMTLALLDDEHGLDLAHVGDSRAYLLRHGELTQLTRDHSVVGELLAAGMIEPDEAATHPQRNYVTRSLGLNSGVEVDTGHRELEANDRLMLCSDGLSGMLSDERIAGLLGGADSPEAAVWDLIEAANAAGGRDNITVVVVDVVAES